MNILEVDSVNLAFSGRTILSDIYLKCETGKIVGLIGRNGSGKSSLMKIIFGTLQAECQSVRINGQFFAQLHKEPKTVHYLPQDGFAMNYLAFSDLIRIFDLKRHLDQILQIDEIRKNQQEKLGNLSGGIKKLMEIITVLYADSRFVLLDEPYSFLSPVLVEKIIPHILHQSQTKGIVLTDHQYESVLSTCNRYYLLAAGVLRTITGRTELEDYGYLTSQKG